MPDLRDLLDKAAGQPSEFPDIDSIRRRARPGLVRRRLAVLLVCTSVALAGWGGLRALGGYLVRGDGQVMAPADIRRNLRLGRCWMGNSNPGSTLAISRRTCSRSRHARTTGRYSWRSRAGLPLASASTSCIFRSGTASSIRLLRVPRRSSRSRRTCSLGSLNTHGCRRRVRRRRQYGECRVNGPTFGSCGL